MLVSGANAPIEGHLVNVAISFSIKAAGLEVDVSAFQLNAAEKIRNDQDFVFYGNQSSPEGGVVQQSSGPSGSYFQIDLSRVPPDVERIALVATIDKGVERKQSFGQVDALKVEITGAAPITYAVATAGATEAALILGELYRRNGQWKFKAIGQGFNGGLKPLAERYGVTIADPTPAAAATSVIDLRKQKVIDLTKRDPNLGQAAQKALISLEKKGQGALRAKVKLVLDISGSTEPLYRSGAMDDLVRRVLALGLQIDDDGDIDVVVFGKYAYHYGTVNEHNYASFTRTMMSKHKLENATMYGEAIDLVREQTRKEASGLPVYCMFVTDGGTQDVRRSKDSIIDASREPIFWQFMAIGRHEDGKPVDLYSKRLPRGFDFLEMLDTMPGRFIDNAGFFAVENPATIPDGDLYDKMFDEFPSWLNLARQHSLVS